MKRPRRTLILACVLCLCALGVLPGAVRRSSAEPDAQSTEAKARLEEIRARIATVTHRLAEQLKERDALLAKLRAADLDMTAKRQTLDALRAAAGAAVRRRTQLLADAERNRQALTLARDNLAALARAAFLMGPQERIKLLLNQDDPASAGRMAAYYGYFARARRETLETVQERLARSQEMLVAIDANDAKLQALQMDAARELALVERARGVRLAALSAVSRDLRSGTDELSQLKREEAAEEALLADLARVIQEFPVDSGRSFADLRGQLPWPVEGRLKVRFQQPKVKSGVSGPRWNGVLIEAERGAKVRAPCAGRVVYADWLQGLGLLLIISHSGNYMTLYGHAEVLYKAVGDWVAAGDVIAALADSGTAAPQLYFEIRDGRTPRDPMFWLKPSH